MATPKKAAAKPNTPRSPKRASRKVPAKKTGTRTGTARLKRPTAAVIKTAVQVAKSTSIRFVNEALRAKGFARITAKQRDAVLKKIESNQTRKPQKQAVGKRTTNGGARANAGRKKGAATKKTREIADQLAGDGGLTPLEYMLGVLREEPTALRKQLEAGDIDSAEFAVRMKVHIDRRDWAAEKAAPYIHPRLASIDATVKKDSQSEWLALMEEMGL